MDYTLQDIHIMKGIVIDKVCYNGFIAFNNF